VAKKSGVQVETLESGDCFGEESFLGHSKVRLMTVCCVAQSEALTLDRDMYDAICLESPMTKRSLANVQAQSEARNQRFLSVVKSQKRPPDTPHPAGRSTVLSPVLSQLESDAVPVEESRRASKISFAEAGAGSAARLPGGVGVPIAAGTGV